MSFFVLNIGNTRTGLALMKNNLPLHTSFVFNNQWKTLENEAVWKLLEKDNNAFLGVSCVASTIWTSFQSFLKKKNLSLKTHLIHPKDQKTISLAYEEQDRLGSDRLVLIHKAQKKFPHHLVIIVDAGTVLSIDVIHKGQHLGGRLTTGLHMALSAMNKNTEHLPLLQNISNHPPFLGKKTKECLLSGVYYEKKLFIKNTLQIISKQYHDYPFLSWITGGDSHFFQSIYDWNICDPFLIFQAISEWFNPFFKK